jgi:hypothetical protein
MFRIEGAAADKMDSLQTLHFLQTTRVCDIMTTECLSNRNEHNEKCMCVILCTFVTLLRFLI